MTKFYYKLVILFKKMDKKFFILACLSSLIFCCFIFLLSYYNRLAADCFVLLNNANKSFPLGCAIEQYFHWQGTFFITWFEHWIFYFVQTSTAYIAFFTGGTYLVLLHSIYFLLGRMPGVNKEFANNYKIKIIYSILIASCFFYMSYDFGQSTWFLVSGTTRYIYPIILLIYTLGIHFKTNLGKSTQIFFLTILYFILGFSTLNYGVIIIFFYSVFIIFNCYSQKTGVQKYIKDNYTIIIPYMGLCIGFLLMLLAPGNYERRDLGIHATTLNELASTSFNTFIYNIKVLIKDKFLLIALYALCFSSFGQYVAFLKGKTTKDIFIMLLSALALLGVIIILQGVVMALALGTDGPYRTYTIHALYLTFFCVLLGLVLSKLFLELNRPKVQTVFYVFGLAGLLFLNVFMAKKYIPVAKRYSNAFDSTISHLTNLNSNVENHNKIMYVAPLPESGLLYPQELAFDTTDYFYPWVREMEKSYNLKFTVLAKKPAQ